MMPRRLLSCLLLSLLCLPLAAGAETVPGRTSFGIRFGDKLAEGYLDWIQPLASGTNNLLFFNPRFGLGDEGANELNVGLGYRQLLGGRGLVGGNVYFDSRRTQHDNRFSQVGAGLEFLSTWVDARGNYYWPVDDSQLAASEVREGTQVAVTEKTTLTYGTWSDPYAQGNQIRQDVQVKVDTAVETATTTTRKTFEDWESARKGYDAELGLLVPLFGAASAQSARPLRVFAGYYHFEDDFGAKIAGPKGRLEWRAFPFLTFDLELYQDKELYGSKAIAAARLHTPFDLGALLQGKNPFPAAAPATGLASRLNEQVMRDVRVQTDKSGFAENQSKRKITVDTVVDRTNKYVQQQYVLLNDVVFVDGDNGVDPTQLGTAEHPFSVIQVGANNVFGQKNLYVYAIDGSYPENVVLQEGTTMVGQGTPIVGMGGKVYGGDVYTVITGQTTGTAEAIIPATVTLANNTIVSGFTVEGGVLGIAGIGVSGNIGVTNNNVVGPSLANILVVTAGDTNLNISGNYAINGLAGIGVLNTGGRLSATVTGNETHGALLGIGVANLDGTVLSVPLLPLLPADTVAFVPTASVPAAATPMTTSLNAAGNLVADGLAGLAVANVGSGSLTAAINGNTADNVEIGLVAANVGSGTMNTAIGGNAVMNTAVGIAAANVGAGAMTAAMDGNTVGNTAVGILGLNIGSSLLFPTQEAAANVVPVTDGTLKFTATNNSVSAGLNPGLIGIGVANASLGATEAFIGRAGAGNLVDGYQLGIGVGNLGRTNFSDAPAGAALLLAPPAPTLSASIVGNTVRNSLVVGIGAGAAGNPESEIVIDGNSIAGAGIGVGIGTIGGIGLSPILPPADAAAGGDPLAFPAGSMGAMKVAVNNNQIASEGLYGVGIYGSANSVLDIALQNNRIAGQFGVYAWTEDFAQLHLYLGGGNTVTAPGPAVALLSHDSSLINFMAEHAAFTSTGARAFVVESNENSLLNLTLNEDQITSSAGAIVGNAYGTSFMNFALTHNAYIGSPMIFRVTTHDAANFLLSSVSADTADDAAAAAERR
jgi:hypothetical protein